MSTRATVHFCTANYLGVKSLPSAIVYRHCDGYPDGLGEDLKKFFAEVERQTTDTRFNDPSYLAAKFIVWQAGQYADDDNKPLKFLSVAPVMADPADIAYRYIVLCGGGVPTVEYQKA